MAEAANTKIVLPYDADRILHDSTLVPADPVSRPVEGPVHPGYRQEGELSRQWSKVLSKTVTAPNEPSLRVFDFQYRPLKIGEIRLVIIRPGKFDDQLELDLRVAPLTDRLKYKALSYEWGEGPPGFEIIIRDFSPVPPHFTPKERFRLQVFKVFGTKFYVRKNLINALRHLRDRDKPLVMWIDAICINQADNGEKAEQIAQMTTIYGTATNVDVWLGTATEKTDNAMDFAREIAKDENALGVSGSRMDLQLWADLMDLMSSRWFSRRWVIQEVAMAKKITVHCGLKRIPWLDFSDAVAIFNDQSDVIEAKQASQTRPQPAIGFDVLGAMGATNLIRAQSHAIERHVDGTVDMKMSLEKLVSSLTSFDAGDPRDIIFAVLHMSRDSPDQLRPNYEHSLLQVYTEFVQHCITSSSSLDILCRHWVPTHTSIKQPDKSLYETTLPSWMSRLDRAAFGPPDKIFRGRRNADSLVNVEKPRYNCSRGRGLSRAEFEFGEKPSDHDTNPSLLVETYDGTLMVRGISLGFICETTPRIIPGKLPQELLAMAGWQHSQTEPGPNLKISINDLPDVLWRTLMAGYDSQGKQAETFYRRASLRCLVNEDVNGDIDVPTLMRDPHAGDAVKSFLKRTQEVVWNRKAFRAGEKKLFGLGPKETRPGDLLCILYGCSVPVILREVSEKPVLGQRRVEVATGVSDIAPTTSGARGWSRGGRSNRGGHKRTGSFHSATDATSKRQRTERPSRKWQKTHKNNPGPFYELIGECFVYGIMDGEALDAGGDRYPQTETVFTLV